MKFVLTLNSSTYLKYAVQTSASEILLKTDLFSAAGGIPEAELTDIINYIENSGKSAILLWDRYCNDKELTALTRQYGKIIRRISTVRFSDPGVGVLLKQTFPDCNRQFLMWDGYQNIVGIQRWASLIPGLKRIILSNQIPVDSIRSVCKSIDIPIEIKVLGRFQLFYSRRRLLQGHGLTAGDTTAASLDRPSQLLPVLDTPYSTVIMNDKELFLLDRMAEISKAGVEYGELEPSTDIQHALLADIKNIERDHAEIRKRWDFPLTAGFFDGNKSDELLSDLSNAFLKEMKDKRIATVLESIKNSHTMVQFHEPVALPCDVVFLTPEKYVAEYHIEGIRDLQQKNCSRTVMEGIYLLPWVKHVVPATIMIRATDQNENKTEPVEGLY